MEEMMSSLALNLFAVLNGMPLNVAAEILNTNPEAAEKAEQVAERLEPQLVQTGIVGGLCALRALHDVLPDTPEYLLANSPRAQAFQAGVDAVHELLDEMIMVFTHQVESQNQDQDPMARAMGVFRDEFGPSDSLQ
jgi:hypothetical protein